MREPEDVTHWRAATAQQFYEKFKDALQFLGPGWSGKNEVQINGEVTLHFKGLSVTINLENPDGLQS